MDKDVYIARLIERGKELRRKYDDLQDSYHTLQVKLDGAVKDRLQAEARSESSRLKLRQAEIRNKHLEESNAHRNNEIRILKSRIADLEDGIER